MIRKPNLIFILLVFLLVFVQVLIFKPAKIEIKEEQSSE